MKNALLFTAFCLTATVSHLFSQTNTSYGLGSLLNTTGINNTAIGYGSLQALSSGSKNTAIGSGAMVSTTIGAENTVVGWAALNHNTSGAWNTAIGATSMSNNLTGNFNTALGHTSLAFNSTGDANTAIGTGSLYGNYTAHFNTALGVNSLYSNSTGDANTALGAFSLSSNSTGYSNIGIGKDAMASNTTGYRNISMGPGALSLNVSGYGNTGIGTSALQNNTTARFNLGVGDWAMLSNSTGIKNTGLGNNALLNNTTGSHNLAAGTWALEQNSTGSQNTAVGPAALYFNGSGEKNTGCGSYAGQYSKSNKFMTFLGAYSDVTDPTPSIFSNSTAIGANSRVSANNQVRLGSTDATSIGGFVGWTILSDGRYKKEIREDVSGLDFLLRLRPVTYNMDVQKLNRDLGIDRPARFVDEKDGEIIDRPTAETPGQAEKAARRFTGFIAQEVSEAAAESGFDFSGIDRPKNDQDPWGLRYDEFVVPLVKAVQEQQAASESQKLEIRRQNERLEWLEKRLAAIELPAGSGSVQPVSRPSSLSPCRPNPVAGTAFIPFFVEKMTHSAQLVLTEMASGRLLKTIELPLGEGTVAIETDSLPAGSIACSLLVDGQVVAAQTILVTK